jgi:hypothetical protein
MSREEAAVSYLDVMLGFKRDYEQFRRATETLSEREKNELLDAVLGQRWTGSRQ